MPTATLPAADARTCVAGRWCKDFNHTRKHPALLESSRATYCPDCLRVAERDVRSLPADYVALEQWLPRPLSEWSDGQPRSGRGEQPLPLREYVLVLQRHIWWLLTAWEPVARELDGLSSEVRAGVREGWAVQHAATVIAPRLARLAHLGPQDMADYPPVDDSLASAVVWGPDRDCSTFILHTAPSGADGIAHLTRMHQLATSATGLSDRVRQLPGFCHQCGEEGKLRQHHPRQFKHDPPVWCKDCGSWRPYDEYERMMGLIVWQGR
jgi:hypothetical protein